jgi:hypothetical protein
MLDMAAEARAAAASTWEAMLFALAIIWSQAAAKEAAPA